MGFPNRCSECRDAEAPNTPGQVVVIEMTAVPDERHHRPTIDPKSGAEASALQGRLAGMHASFRLEKINADKLEALSGPLVKSRKRPLSIRPFLDSCYTPAPSYLLPDEYSATGVGLAFLAATYLLVLRRDDDGAVRQQVRFAGHVERAEASRPQLDPTARPTAPTTASGRPIPHNPLRD